MIDDWTNGSWPDQDALADAEDIAIGLESVVHESLLHSESALDAWVTGVLGRLTPVEAESALAALRDVGRAVTSREVRSAIGSALPAVGGIVGTVYGGPAGAAIGGALGQAAGQAVSGAPRAAPPPRASAAPPAAPAQAPSVPAGPQGGSQAAGQLLHLVQDPAVMQSLLALVMGAQGKGTVPVGERGSAVPVGVMMNLIGTLAQRAAADAEQIESARRAMPGAYLLDAEGHYMCDPAAPDERADALVRLVESAQEHLYT